MCRCGVTSAMQNLQWFPQVTRMAAKRQDYLHLFWLQWHLQKKSERLVGMHFWFSILWRLCLTHGKSLFNGLRQSEEHQLTLTLQVLNDVSFSQTFLSGRRL
mmetsp:Transcript_129264/g.228651  ORF Transcript_129264/g.228651 Transcript_129264/m.228651 type:complete len:102 (+) Transcript_129264:368-673(+)